MVLRMIRLSRLPAVLGISLVVVAAYLAWSVYGAWPVPAGYEFPRHSHWEGGPTALYEGALAESHGCITTEGGDTVIWPPGSWLSLDDGKPVVHVSGRDVRMGEPVRLVGGSYSRDEVASVVASAAGSRCPEPFWLTTGIAD
jgi:hypothetical protein